MNKIKKILNDITNSNAKISDINWHNINILLENNKLTEIYQILYHYKEELEYYNIIIKDLVELAKNTKKQWYKIDDINDIKLAYFLKETEKYKVFIHFRENSSMQVKRVHYLDNDIEITEYYTVDMILREKEISFNKININVNIYFTDKGEYVTTSLNEIFGAEIKELDIKEILKF